MGEIEYCALSNEDKGHCLLVYFLPWSLHPPIKLYMLAI